MNHISLLQKPTPGTCIPLSNGSLDFLFCQAQPQEKKGEEHLQLIKIVCDI